MTQVLRRTIHTVAWLLAIGGVVGAGILIYIYFTPTAASPLLASPENNTSADGTKKTVEQLAQYTVPPSHPRHLSIPSLSLNANILPVGTLANGAMDAPASAWDVGWYNKSSLPGSANGALLIDGHVNDSRDQPGIFASLHTLKAGDEIKIERGDGQLFTYAITQVEQISTSKVDMTRLLRSSTSEKEGLNLITCSGEYDAQHATYTDRVVVHAVRAA